MEPSVNCCPALTMRAGLHAQAGRRGDLVFSLVALLAPDIDGGLRAHRHHTGRLGDDLPGPVLGHGIALGHLLPIFHDGR